MIQIINNSYCSCKTVIVLIWFFGVKVKNHKNVEKTEKCILNISNRFKYFKEFEIFSGHNNAVIFTIGQLYA